jgi:dipeptidyl aminopeptidase/acylaminoacyl peptidase
MVVLKRMLTCIISVSVFLSVPLQTIAEDLRPLSVEDFSSIPRSSSFRISPDGTKVAYFYNMGNTTLLCNTDFSTGKMLPLIKADNKKFRFRWFSWANNNTIVFSAIFPSRRGAYETMESRLFTAKADNSEETKLLTSPKTTEEHLSQFQDNVISMLPDDPDHILVAIDAEKPLYPSVYKVNINTTQRERVKRTRSKVGQWMTDQQDRVRLGITFDRRSTKRTLIIYNLKRNKWKKAWKFDIVSDPPIEPLGFGLDPNILYVRTDHNGRNAIFKVDVTNPDLPMDLVVKDDDYDINGALIRSPKTRDAVGVRHGEADTGSIYWNEDFKKFQIAVDKALPDTQNHLIDFSKDLRRYIVFSTSSTRPGTYYLGDRDRNSLDIIDHTYPQLEGRLQGSKKIEYKTRDGITIEGYLTLPGNYDPEKRYPAVVFPHGGPMARDRGDFDPWVEFFASKGLVVLQPNFRGSSGYGWKFMMKGLKNFGLAMQDDLTDAANWLIRNNYADPKRIAIVGGSYGGYAALMGAVKTPDLFRCAISFAGISDLIVLKEYSKMYANYKFVFEMLGEDKDQLKATSPRRNVDRIKIPILLAHGDADRVVPVEQSKIMAEELEKNNKIFTYIELEKGNHNISNQENRHRFFKAMDEFLDKYLL